MKIVLVEVKLVPDHVTASNNLTLLQPSFMLCKNCQAVS